MRTLALFAALFAFACASPTAVIDSHTYQCGGPGQEVTVEAGIDQGNGAGGSEMTGVLEYLVRVTNNAHDEVTVKNIRVDPSERSTGIDSAAKAFDHTIAENDEYIFHLPITFQPMRGFSPSGGRPVEFSVAVALTNGDTYRCQFASALR